MSWLYEHHPQVEKQRDQVRSEVVPGLKKCRDERWVAGLLNPETSDPQAPRQVLSSGKKGLSENGVSRNFFTCQTYLWKLIPYGCVLKWGITLNTYFDWTLISHCQSWLLSVFAVSVNQAIKMVTAEAAAEEEEVILAVGYVLDCPGELKVFWEHCLCMIMLCCDSDKTS